MLDVIRARAGLAAIVRDLLDGSDLDIVTVYRSGLDKLADFPCVVIGQPNWTPEGPTLGVPDAYTWPVAVILARPGEPSPETVDILDEIWGGLMRGLQDASAADGSLGDIAAESQITGSTFAPFNVQGLDYPAQTISVVLYG